MNQPAISIEDLSRYLDGEVTPEEHARLAKLLGDCAMSQKVLARLREVTQTISTAIAEQAPPIENAPTNGCFDDDTLIRLADNKLNPAEQHRVEAHALGCQYCMRRVVESVRSAVSMNMATWRELPEKVRNDQRLAPLKNIKPQARKFDIADAVHAEIISTMVANEKTSKDFTVGEYVLRVTVLAQRGEFANLELLLLHHDKPKPQTEITVLVSGVETKVFRGATSLDGRILVRRLRAGAYDIYLHAANLVVTALIGEQAKK